MAWRVAVRAAGAVFGGKKNVFLGFDFDQYIARSAVR
jgi:hypothetical protein